MLLVFAPYKIKNLFSAKDAISKLSRSRVVYKFSCAGCSACYFGETNRHLATRVREHLSSDKNSHIFQHINGSEACRSLCSEDCFSILDTASKPFQLKIKEALHIAWEKPSFNKQVNHVNLALSLQFSSSYTHCLLIIVFSITSHSRCYLISTNAFY